MKKFHETILDDTPVDAKVNDEMKNAAYALNMCTVSISQIIDYKDLNILEQEYEAILNNINLEYMPKDEALLNILKQLLDTITYFRLEDTERKIIDKEYQQKMKNAVWSAVPNFGLIVAGGNPITIAVSLASQVGIGYMNYRRNKAEYDLGLEKQLWQLQRAAIEQFNGLRRELFDTAWRLADKYNFPDEYRLTERQISQYNDILLDTDPIRKYERLDFIKENFQAYPPFWYHFGNTANQIAQKTQYSSEIRDIYKIKAMNHFDSYFELNNNNLLREDQIAAACALEYVDLLDTNHDKEKINQLIKEAQKHSGGAHDVLELCAIAYLKLNQFDSASLILRQLVNEDYNAIMNAQLLSCIYVKNYINNINAKMAWSDYTTLATRVDRDLLYPMPNQEFYQSEHLNRCFIDKQQEVLTKKYKMVLQSFIKKYTIKYNKVFPVPDSSKTYVDSFFEDSDLSRKERFECVEKVMSNPRKKIFFCEALKDEQIIYDAFAVVNEMYYEICSLDILQDYQLIEDALKLGIEKVKEDINLILEALFSENYEDLRIGMLTKVCFKDISYDFFKEINRQLYECIETAATIQEITMIDDSLRSFCIAQNIILPDELYSNISKKNIVTKIVQENVISPKLLGTNFSEFEKVHDLKRDLKNIIFDYQDVIIKGGKDVVLVAGSREFDEYFATKKEKTQRLKKDTVAIIDNRTSIVEKDLLFTCGGIVTMNGSIVSDIVPYNTIKQDDDTLKGLKYDINAVAGLLAGVAAPPLFVLTKISEKIYPTKDNFKYKNKNINIDVLYKMICEFDKKVSKQEILQVSIDSIENKKDRYDFLEV